MFDKARKLNPNELKYYDHKGEIITMNFSCKNNDYLY